ncbi:MAG TPA: MFS transporter [bacterium]
MTEAAQPTARRATVIFIFITVVIDVVALGVIIPVLPQLVVDFEGGNAVKGAQMYALFGSVWSLMQFFAAPLLGALSDHYGRRPVILISIFGLGVDYLFMAMAPTLAWLFVGRVISGITASNFTTAGARRATVIFIFITVVIDVVALGVIIPVLPQLVVDFEGGNAVKGAQMYALFGSVWSLMQFFAAPLLGALSDRYGRRPVILISIFGLGVDYLFMAMAPTLAWLFVGRVISGITASNFTTAGAYIADVTPPEKRAAGFGMLGAAFSVGFVLGPAVGGLLGAVSPRLPFWVAAALTLVNAVYGVFVLPESLPKDKRAAFSWRNANPLGSLALLRSHPQLMGLAGVTLLFYVAHDALPSVFVLYVNYRFGWDALAVGVSLAAVGVAVGIAQGALVGPIVKWAGERATALAALGVGVVSFAVFGFATAGWMIYGGIVLNALWSLFGPASSALMSRRVEADAQGRLQGALGGLHAVTAIGATAIFPLTFAWAIAPGSPFPHAGAPFMLGSALLGLALLLGLWVMRKE